MRIVRHEIAARSGPALGVFFAGLAPLSEPSTNEFEALSAGVRLASLAIENRRIYSDMLYRSDFDLLTDVHNRFSLEKHLDNQIEKAHASTTIFGLVYIDLDGFKQVNDLYGHHVGDLYLQEASLRMKRQLRAHDVLARMGGDEFTVLLTRVHSRADVQEIALRLKHCFDASFMVDGQKLSGSASVGIALYPEDGATKDSLLSVADAAMYRAKKSSKQAAAMEATAAPALLSASRI
jgi:diguanylate cyclase (GGDEF)-like protein